MLQETASERVAVVAGVEFEPATLRTEGIEHTTEPPRPIRIIVGRGANL